MFYYLEYKSPIGNLIIISDKENIVGLWIEGQKHFKSTISSEIEKAEDLPILNQAKEWLDRYFKKQKPSPKELKLNPEGNNFRKLVWKYLLEIPYGETTTYGEIAKKVAMNLKKERMSAQAVGGAIGHNPISIIIPCHRVIGANGNLTGYDGGINIKKKLLELEEINTNQSKQA